ncbi:MAG: 6-phosphofructokinase [Actinobacteria bacterium]|nr:6-phosphofructokinase [Actinomycetota bacterium]MCL6095262.1 6-phosphofructokinase [Actinomycetota bacterium]
MRIGLLTGGGDCPGLNAAIRAIVFKAEMGYGDEVVGFADGWRGVMEDAVRPLDVNSCRDILPLGGTILGTSRTNPYSTDGGVEKVLDTLRKEGVDVLIAIGGDDTLGVAHKLSAAQVAVVGVPKTIDNDLSATEVTFGFDTAVQIATDAIDRLRTTAESHHRVIVCEVMGRHAGWIATLAGLAGGAAEILVPEEPFDIEAVCKRLQRLHDKGQFSSIVVIAEGAKPAKPFRSLQGASDASGKPLDQFGHERLGGISNAVAEEIEARTGFESRVTILGHVQRGGTPTAYDRVLATRFGVAAVEACHDGAFDTMVALHAGEIIRVPLEEAVGVSKTVDLTLLHDVVGPFLG